MRAPLNRDQKQGEASMRYLFKFASRALKKSFTKFLDRVGSKVVSGMADTSSDAPSAFHKPKRDLYSKIKEQNPE